MTLEAEINDPREIRNLSEAILEEAENSGEDIYVGLNHNHYSLVRGRNEESRDLNQDFDLGYPVEIFREDGGNTWAHSPESRCYEKATSIDPSDAKRHEKLMRQWGQEAKAEIEDYLQEEGLEIDPVYNAGDIYDQRTGKQIAGLSAEIHGGMGLFRMCVYDGDDHGEKFHDLIEQDLQTAEVELADPRENYLPLPGLYDHLMPENPESLDVDGELDTGRPRENALPAEYCVSRFPFY